MKSEEMNNLVKKYIEEFNISEILARTLINRGIDFTSAKHILEEPHKLILNPLILTNTKEAADMIDRHIKNNSFIFIFADYDVDGLTSGYVLQKSIQECYPSNKVLTYYPNRSEGYGLSQEWCDTLISRMKGSNINPKDILVITVDNGIGKINEITTLQENGIEVLVTDHHESLGKVPNCLIVNPHNKSEKQHEDTLGLSGCGVAFKIAQVLQAKYDKYNMLSYTPYVALSIMADMMPMTLENIALVIYGLSIINSDSCPLNFKMFKDYLNKQTMNSKDLSFDISPKLNSCGRIDSIETAQKFLFEEDYDLKYEYFLEVFKADDKRKEYAKKANEVIEIDEITEDQKAIVINLNDVPSGVLGVIANNIKRKTNMPVIALKEEGDFLVGSARSTDNINLLKAIQKIDEETDIIETFGGHSASLGVSIKKDTEEQLQQMLNKTIEEEIIEDKREVDAIIKLKDINMNIHRELSRIPFNNIDLLPPLVSLENVEVKKMKHSSNNKENIKLTVKDETGILDIWAWNFGTKYKELGSPRRITMNGEIDQNFMNPRFATLQVVNIE